VESWIRFHKKKGPALLTRRGESQPKKEERKKSPMGEVEKPLKTWIIILKASRFTKSPAMGWGNTCRVRGKGKRRKEKTQSKANARQTR